MSGNRPDPLPPFQPFATAAGILSDQEIDALLAEHAPRVEEAKLGPGNRNAEIRRSQVVILGLEDRYRWLYERLWTAALECNRLFFAADLKGVEGNIQLTRYGATDSGFYHWHTDFAGLRPLRKLSISIQLSRSEDYDGGDLELMYEHDPVKVDRTRGAFVVFPSFILHRVTPVTRGTRWSLVAWVLGERWR